MNLNELLTLYCEQQEAAAYYLEFFHDRNASGEYPVKRVSISVHWTVDFMQPRKPEFMNFDNEEEAITELQKLTSLNKAIA
jgi:hypothetical protein